MSKSGRCDRLPGLTQQRLKASLDPEHICILGQMTKTFKCKKLNTQTWNAKCLASGENTNQQKNTIHEEKNQSTRTGSKMTQMTELLNKEANITTSNNYIL